MTDEDMQQTLEYVRESRNKCQLQARKERKKNLELRTQLKAAQKKVAELEITKSTLTELIKELKK